MTSSEAIQNEIKSIIGNLHQRIGGRATRHQYPSGKAQEKRLAELGLLDMMPAGFGHSDAKAVIEAAEAAEHEVGGFTEDYEGDVTTMRASKLYTLLHSESADDASPIVQYLRSVKWTR